MYVPLLTAATRGRRSPDPFGQFVLRAKILGLYRQFVRASRPMGDLPTRLETLAFFRSDFDRLANVQDIVSATFRWSELKLIAFFRVLRRSLSSSSSMVSAR